MAGVGALIFRGKKVARRGRRVNIGRNFNKKGKSVVANPEAGD